VNCFSSSNIEAKAIAIPVVLRMGSFPKTSGGSSLAFVRALREEESEVGEGWVSFWMGKERSSELFLLF